ncbi:MAG TPA: hypothetical protein GXZ97_06215 [Hydrogenispora sp.]|jgi:hypothetical protein|nr:hypothetical protein [Hydrogenispora sp.]
MRKCILGILLLILTLFLATGCEVEEGILQQFAGERFGLIMETDPYTYERSLETRLINYIRKRFDLQVINPKLLMDDGQYTSRMVEDFCRDELGLDLLLTIKLTDIIVNEPKPNLEIRPHRVAVEVSASCSLTLIYTLRDLSTDQILYFGQSNGSSKATNKVKASEGGVHFDFKEFDPYELIEDAMFDALRNSELL